MKTDYALLRSIKIGRKTLSNRIAINAMECCDADTGGNPTHTAFRRYERLARGNAGMIVVEALSVVDENLGGPHQSLGYKSPRECRAQLPLSVD